MNMSERNGHAATVNVGSLAKYCGKSYYKLNLVEKVDHVDQADQMVGLSGRPVSPTDSSQTIVAGPPGPGWEIST
jgi:hypothetical protein